ncbi:MAG: transcription elongation factor GreA [Anaerolineae bacterium]|jgi:transcription elongation factor GreA|nr:transcription elongation factor GreA [Anaerolineae bacterium]MBT7073918.1 transcription elongation factor GreA [Anaerolineae bacterium]MBT7781317.1 transcription elongation factor GreA [Anaerolineae bacterium]
MPTSYLTKDGFINLQRELDDLRSVKRNEVAERLREAMEDGELIENAEFESAKNEQSFVEGRISELKQLLANAHIIDYDDQENGKSKYAQVGSTIFLREDGEKNSEKYVIVGAAEADPRNGMISNESPIGKAAIGHKAGEEIEIATPAGKLKFKITTVRYE